MNRRSGKAEQENLISESLHYHLNDVEYGRTFHRSLIIVYTYDEIAIMNDPQSIFRDSRQERIFRQLKLLVGPGVATFYMDLCRLNNTQPPFETTTHLAGHLIREIESSIRKVLAVFHQEQNRPATNGHRWEIEQILKGLAIPENNPIARFWLTNVPNSLAHGVAHRDNLLPPRPYDEKFEIFLGEMDAIFDFILEKFETKYLAVYRTLDEKLLIENPTTKDAQWLKVNTPNNQAALNYFFTKLTNPVWLSRLRSEGLFDRPPNAIFDSERSTKDFPQWPLSRYLTKMATVDPNSVCEIFLGLETNNITIHEDAVDAACLLPENLAMQITLKEIGWLQSQQFIGHLLPSKFATLTIHLTNSSETDSAFSLSKEILKVLPYIYEQENEGAYYFPKEPRTLLDTWGYAQFINKCLFSLVSADWEKALRLFAELLEEYLDRKYHSRRDKADSCSYIWHPDIGNDSEDLPSILIKAIRVTVESTLLKDNESLQNILSILESFRWDVFRRIELYTLLRSPNKADARITRKLLSKANFDNQSIFHEYVLLLASSFSYQAADDQQTILDWIDCCALSIEEVKEKYFEWDKTVLSDDEAEAYIRRKKLNWLEPLKDVLPSSWKEKHSEWTKQLGTLHHPTYLTATSHQLWVGDPPVSSVLSTMDSIKEIAEYLGQPENRTSEYPEGISIEFSRLVQNNPNEFIKNASLFKKLDVKYLCSYLSGIRSAANSISSNELPILLEFLKFLLNWQPTGETVRVDKHHSLNPLLDISSLVNSLISTLLREYNSDELFSYRKEIWEIIKLLVHQEHIDEEQNLNESEMDPLTFSLNTVRGNACHTIFQYIRWCKTQEGWLPGFQSVPEVLEVLEQHLTLEYESSLAVRAVYAQELPMLVWLDAEWVGLHIYDFFPVEEEKRQLRKGSWETFIIWTKPFDNVFETLKEEYEMAIGRLEEETLYNSHSPARNLAEHIVVFYLRGKIEIGDGGILDKFYTAATDDLCSHVFCFIGRVLKEPELSKEALNKITKLVESRIAKSHGSTKEMQSFGWIFLSNRFSQEWRISKLKETLEKSRNTNPDSLVVEALTEFTSSHPLEVVYCITLLVSGVEDQWKLQYWAPQIKKIITSIDVKHDRNPIIELVNILSARGLVEFRDLI